MTMTDNHVYRLERIRLHLRGTHFTEHLRVNFHVFETHSERGAELAKDFIRSNSLLKPLLEFTKADAEFGVLILNRQMCCYCQKEYGEHVPAGGKCLFDSTDYATSPL